jgi:hypothetical protein
MPNIFMIKGVCPVCGSVKQSFNPALPMSTNLVQQDRERKRSEKYPSSVWRCYHNGTPFHDNKNFTSKAGSDVPMHMFYQCNYGQHNVGDRVYPNANDDCNKKHWRV